MNAEIRACDRCGEADGTVEIGSVLRWCQPCFDSATDEAADIYSPVNMLLNTISDATITRDEFKARLLEIVRAAVAAETERCARVAEAEPEYPDASEEQHPHVVALIREHPVVAAQAIAADVKKSIARAIRTRPTSGAAAGGDGNG